MLDSNNLQATTGSHGFNAYSFQQKEMFIFKQSENGTNIATSYDYSRTSSAYNVDISHQAQNNSVLTYDHLQQNYQSTNLSTQQAEETAVIQESPDLLEGASNILNFIEQRLAIEKENGASDQALEELVQQGLAGFKQGYNEALDILKETGGLSDIVNAEVNTLYEQVINGFNDLRQTYIDNPEITNTNIESTANTNNIPAPRILNSDSPNDILEASFKSFATPEDSLINSLLNNLSEVEASVSYNLKNSFSFQLTTTDGDTISIQANNSLALSGDYSVSNSSTASSIHLEETIEESNYFNLSISGELDEQELVAIEDLLSQVFSLADEFYQGDVESAFQAAVNLGYDQQEITNYSLNLKQTESYQVAAAYQQFTPEELPPQNHSDPFNLIGSYAQNILENLNNPNNYQHFNYAQLLEQIAEQIDQQINDTESYGFYDMVDELVSKLV